MNKIKLALFIFLGVFLVFIGLILFPSYKTDLINTEEATAQSDIRALHSIIESFKNNTGRYPTNEEGFQILVEENVKYEIKGYKQGGYLGKVPLDPWENKYHYYLFLNNEGESKIDISSYGPDRKTGQ